MSLKSANLFANLTQRKIFDVLGSAGGSIEERVLNNIGPETDSVGFLIKRDLVEYERPGCSRVKLTEKGKKVYELYDKIRCLTP